MRNLQDWKSEEYEALLLCLSHIQIKNHGDKLCWKNKNRGKFTVSSFYDYLDGQINRNQLKFPAKIIWRSGAPPKISWEAAKEKILTLDNLMRRGIPIANRCYLCKMGPESCNHLLLWCPFSHKLWVMILGLLGLSWVMANIIFGEPLAWEGLSISIHALQTHPPHSILGYLEGNKQKCF